MRRPIRMRREGPADAAPLRALVPLLPYLARYRGRALAALAALTVASAVTLAVPLAVRRMIDHGFSESSAGLINNYFAAMIAIVAVLACASAARYYCVMTLGDRIVADLRSDLFGHLTRLDAAFYDRTKSGELVSRLTADTLQMKAAFGSSASVALRNLFMFVGAVVMMVLTSPKLSAFVLIAIPVIVLPLMASGRGVRRRSRRAQDVLADATSFAAESLGAVRIMQAFTAERVASRKFAEAAEAAYVAARDATSARAILTGIAIFLAFSSVVIVLWVGARDVLAGAISAGLLSQFVLFAVLAASALGQLSEVWSEISAAAGSAGRISELLTAEPQITSAKAPLKLAVPTPGDIAFGRVSFVYPSGSDARALHDVSFHVAPGESVAIVGPSGAGKTTLFQLLMRFYDPQSGAILLDGSDIRALAIEDVRRQIALVPQDSVIFGISVAENIAYGAEHASDAEIRAAAAEAGADEFIRVLPEGYDTRLGERGSTLSGGQRQRLAIARAIIRDAPILLLDEATSSLDAESESLVQSALERLMRGRTTLVIAHRLATVLKADRILVMDAGRIVEQGTHASLVAAGGLYARLAHLQFDTGRLADAAE
ncbi:MAG TPA: ABC transporter transmembrane domain-containing protein [Beijerinckiaceae bacterium]|nr:ABC transporter transmembrane domain-containing protein [Beijerinckiaceae bacterium]